MYTDGLSWSRDKIMSSLCLMVLLAQLIVIVDSNKSSNPSINRQMCTKLQSMLSFGKYQTSQMSSNITYVPRIYAQNFLAYSPMDDLLIFIEPKHQIHVYNAQTVQLIVNLSTTDVVIATSCTSLVSESRHDLYFIYATHSTTNLIALRVCQVHFNVYKLSFDSNYCIETIKLQYDQPNLRIYGFTIKRDHAGTKKSLLFISTEIGLIYVIFETHTGVLFKEPVILNETLNEGSVVLSLSNSIYYASKQEHIIYELRITADFRLYYGNITKTKAIKSPFGLITDECNHLYIATRSMILIMYVQSSVTIRSVFSKSSDLPITLERLNATTYVYATIKKQSTKLQPHWMFNFLYFTEPEKVLPVTRHPVIELEDDLDITLAAIDHSNIPTLWPLSYSLLSTTNITKKYTQFASTPRKPFARLKKKKSKTASTSVPLNREGSSTVKNNLLTEQPFGEQSTSDAPDDSHPADLDDDLDNTQFDLPEQMNQTLEQENPSDTDSAQDTESESDSFPENQIDPSIPIQDLQDHSEKKENLTVSHDLQLTSSSTSQPLHLYGTSNPLNTTRNPKHPQLSRTNYSHNFEGNGNQPFFDNEQLYNYLAKHPISESKSLNGTNYIEGTSFTNDNLRAYFGDRTNLSKTQITEIQTYLTEQLSSDQNIFSKYLTSTRTSSRPQLPGMNVGSQVQEEENHALHEDTQIEDRSDELLPLDPTYFNHTTGSEQVVFTVDDLRAYLQGSGNLSTSQQTQIQMYLDKQSASNQPIFSKHSTTTKPPSSMFPHEDHLPDRQQNEDTMLDDLLRNVPLVDSRYFNFSTGPEQILIAKDDVQSYLEGRGNLSKTQIEQIHAYFAQQSSSSPSPDQNIPSRDRTSTTDSTRLPLSDTNTPYQLPRKENQSLSEDQEAEKLLEEVLALDPTYFNPTKDAEKVPFTVDDLRGYLHGRGDLSTDQQAQIEAYLTRQSASNQNIFSKHSTSTKPSTTVSLSDDNRHHDHHTEDTKLNEFLNKIPLIDSKYFNFSTNEEVILIAKEDLQSYLQGEGTLSKTQEAQIQAYLAKQSSPDPNPFSKYVTTTRKPGSILVNGSNISSRFTKVSNGTVTEDQHSDNHVEAVLPYDLDYLNHTTNSEERLFTADDLQAYLQGRGNLSTSQQTQIQAYLDKQIPSNQTIFSKHSTTTKPPSSMFPHEGNVPDHQQNEDTMLDDLLKNVPLVDSRYFNFSTGSEQILIAKDGVQSYLEGRGNLTKTQIEQIHAYFAQQSSSSPSPYQNIPSQYRTSTTESTRPTLSDTNTPYPLPRKENQSLSEDQEAQKLLEEILALDPTYFNPTKDAEKVPSTVDGLRAYLQGRGNLSTSQQTQIQAYLDKQIPSNQTIFSKHSTTTKPPSSMFPHEGNVPDHQQNEDTMLDDLLKNVPLVDSRYFNFSTGSEQILIAKDDVQSYLEGRGNLSKTQIEQIHAYFAQQSSSSPSPDQNIPSRDRTSTTYSTRPTLFGTSIPSQLPRNENQSRSEDQEAEKLLEEVLALDPTYFNHSKDGEKIPFIVDDLRGYLHGRGDLSTDQQAQIEAYLTRQSSSNQSLPKYSTSTKAPTGVDPSDDDRHRDHHMEDTKLNEFLNKIPLIDSKYFNFSSNTEEIFISKDDLLLHLQGRGNLSTTQQAQIEAYFAAQSSSSDQDTLSEYLTSTRKSQTSPSSGVNVESPSQKADGHSSTENSQPEDESKELLPLDLNYFNNTKEPEKVLFTVDDLRTYLRGEGNLSLPQQAQIETYLARQASTNQSVFSKLIKSTTLPTSIHTSNNNTVDNDKVERAKLMDLINKLPLIDSKYLNISANTEQGLISKDDLLSYLQGRGNLSKIQETQIETYLVAQSSSDQNIFAQYRTSTKMPRRPLVPGTDVESPFEKEGNHSLVDDTQREEQAAELLPIDSTYFNHTKGLEKILFTVDDLRTYLKGEGNLSLPQQVQIEAYLARQASTNQSIFSKEVKSTTSPTTKLVSDTNMDHTYPNVDAQLEDLLKKIPVVGSNYFNFSTNTEEKLISKDDLVSYLQGRGNLSKIQENQIEAYLVAQSSSDQDIFSRYRTSTAKPRRPLLPGTDIESQFEREGNYSLAEDISTEDQFQELLPLDPTYFNHSKDAEKVLFTVDDLQAYLKGGSNLSSAQQAQIQGYLTRQSSSNQSIFSKYSTNTKPSTTISLSDENVGYDHHTGNTKLDDFLNKIPLIDSKYFNFSSNTEEILISKDDLLLHLQGRGNLSTTQQAQIEAYFAAQPSSSDQDTLSEYLTSTTKSRTSPSSGVNMQSQTAWNNSRTEDTLPEDKFKELLPLDPTYFNHSKHAEKILFTVDDLQTYLKGGSNLSSAQQAQIKTYLARQASANQSIYSKHIKSTQPPTTTVRPSDDDTDQDDQNEQTKLEELLETIPLVDSKYFHFSTNTEEILIPREDLLAHLQGRRNLSKIQETQIQAYLASQPSADQNMLSQYLTSTRKPRTTPLPDVNVDSQSQIEEEDPTSEDAPPEDGSEELVPLDVTYFNRTTEVEKVLFTVDDLRDYLYGRGNLTSEQQAQIEAYLTRQASLNRSIFSKQIKSTTTTPTRQYGSNDNTDDDYHIEDGKLMDLINKIPLIDSKYLNFSTNTEQSLVSKDDLLSYLQSRGNLSKIQETQIETYLAAQSPDDQNIYAQYRASIKKRRKSLMPGTDTESQFRRKGNYSLTEDMPTENQFQELLPLDVTHFNHTKGSEKLLFTVDDLRAYLQGRGNLSSAQQAQIQAYLAKQAASNQSIFFKHTRSTKPPRRLYSSNDSIHDDSLSEDRNLENFLERLRPTDSKYSNSSTESEKTSITVDDLRSYLHGKGNLSKSQELLIETYFTKNESLGNNTFNISNTTLSPAYRSRLWSQLFHSPAYSSTRSPTVTRFSSSKFVSEVDANTKTSLHSELNSDDPDMTPIPPYSSDSPSFPGTSRLPHQSTSATITSDMPKGKLLSTHSHISRSSTVITRRPSSGSSMSSAPSRSPKKQSSKRPETRIESSSPSYVKTSGIFSPNDQSTSTTLLPRNDLHSPSTSKLEKTSTRSVITSSKKEGIRSSDYASLGTTEKLPQPFTLPPWFTHSYKDGLVSDRSSFQWTSTIFPPFYKPKPLSPENEPAFDLHQPLSTTTTTARRYRTRKQKIIRWQTSQSSITSSSSSSSTTTTIKPSNPTTAIHVNQSTTSTQLSLWHSQWHPLEQQQMFIIKPSSPKNGTNILLSNDYLNDLFNNISTSTNASEDKLIYFNLLDLPPSSWNFSLKSNESITLDITLPSAFSSSNLSTTTNLTFTNIEANRFSTNIIGQPIRLHVDRVHAKQFSLKMNTTNDDIHSDRRIQHLSDVIIGHVTSEQFQLNLTKSDKMHVHVQQVDSATAELYLDGSFCTNDSSLEINLNLSKNGTIRYGNRTPIHIGPVFTRVHMLKQSCDREQPLSLFFDICEQQNPCSNNGSCVSVMPDYTDVSYLPSETGHIGYECSCPRHTSGEHCQHSDYPLGYCLNGGTLFRIYDRDDKLVEKCICSTGFQGEYCEENIDNCIGIDCSGRGVCDDGIDTYTCSCFDGFYGSHCERTRVQTILLQAASRSFGIIAILLIAAIAGLVVASDIHTYLTRKHQKNSVLNKLPRITSEMFENSVLLLGFGDAPIEMNDLSNVRMMQKPRRVRKQQRQTKRTTRIRKTAGYRQVTKKRPVATLSSGRQPISKQPHSTLL